MNKDNEMITRLFEKELTNALAERNAARAERDALRDDAEQYRWIALHAYEGVNVRNECLWSLRGIYAKTGQSFDAAIRAAIKGEK